MDDTEVGILMDTSEEKAKALSAITDTVVGIATFTRVKQL